MKYYFPLYLDSGNRGCQGIAEGTAKILNKCSDELIGYCEDIDLEERLGVSKHYTLLPIHESLCDKITKQLEKLVCLKKNRNEINNIYRYKWFLNQMSKDDIMISTGGDMLCYNGNVVNTTNNILHKKSIKTILWGCSMGKENETPEKIETLKNFTFIYARETLTFEYFKSLGLSNVVCLPDPAFVLEPERVVLPDIFSKYDNIIGLNISPYVLKNNDLNSSFGKVVKCFLDYIVNETDFAVVLIPHVFWEKQDDRVTAKILKDLYPYEERISVIDSDKWNYMQIRYVISKCAYFIGARTHAVISAYSTCIPTIALGYSIKSKGIAKDIGMPVETILDSTTRIETGALISAFKYLMKNRNDILDVLHKNSPDYRMRPYLVKEMLTKLIEV